MKNNVQININKRENIYKVPTSIIQPFLKHGAKTIGLGFCQEVSILGILVSTN